MSIVTSTGNSNEQVVSATMDWQLEVRRPAGSQILRPREKNGPVPLSFAQERLWFLDQINPSDVSSNISRGVRISGALDREALEQAIANAMARHDSLRTTFARIELSAAIDGQPMQLLAATPQVELSLIDLLSAPLA